MGVVGVGVEGEEDSGGGARGEGGGGVRWGGGVLRLGSMYPTVASLTVQLCLRRHPVHSPTALALQPACGLVPRLLGMKRLLCTSCFPRRKAFTLDPRSAVV